MDGNRSKAWRRLIGVVAFMFIVAGCGANTETRHKAGQPAPPTCTAVIRGDYPDGSVNAAKACAQLHDLFMGADTPADLGRECIDTLSAPGNYSLFVASKICTRGTVAIYGRRPAQWEAFLKAEGKGGDGSLTRAAVRVPARTARTSLGAVHAVRNAPSRNRTCLLFGVFQPSG